MKIAPTKPQAPARMVQPIDRIEWIHVDNLTANDWNPNFVYGPEYRLLELSILKTGWIQPVLVNKEGAPGIYEIIDGFHRSALAKGSSRIREMTDGKVPCAVLELTVPERMLLTVRINRAKGSHIAIRMHDLVSKLVQEHGMDPVYVAQSIGATKDEIDLLLQEGIFKALKIEEHQYSKAWVPK